MSGGNGADIGQVVAMLGTVLEGQQEMRRDIRGIRSVLNEHTAVLNEHTVLLHDHGRRLNDLSAQVASLREAVTAYHATVMGHGILISELDARLRRVEHHLGLPSDA